MLKRDAVVLVSRAIAALMLIGVGQGLFAIIRILLSSPDFGVHPYGGTGPVMSGPLAAMLWPLLYNLFVFALFWKCGPWIANFLLPASERSQNSDQPD